MFDNKDGITYGTCMDTCIECRRERKDTKPGDLEYKEVFRLYNNGNPICYCMDHFKKMLGKYMLVDPNYFEEESEDEKISTNGSSNCDIIEEEIVEEAENARNAEIKKLAAKKAKAEEAEKKTTKKKTDSNK